MATDLLQLAKEANLPMTGIPDEFLRTTPPKEVAPEITPEAMPLNINDTEQYRQDIGQSVGQFQEESKNLERQKELQQQIAAKIEEINQKQALKSAVEAGYLVKSPEELSQEEKDAFDITEPVEDPEITRLKQEQEDLNATIDKVQGELDTLKAGYSTAQSNLITSIQNDFKTRKDAMEEVNRREQAIYKTIGMRLSTAQYSPLSATGVVASAERAGIMKLAELDAQEKRIIADAQMAYQQQDYERVYQSMQDLNVQREKVNDKIWELQGIARKKTEEAQKYAQKITNQTKVADLISKGITNPLDIFNATKMPIEEINEALDFFIADEGINQGLGSVIAGSGGTDSEGNRVVSFYNPDTGEINTISLYQEQEDKGKISTPQEIEDAAKSILDGFSNVYNYPLAIRTEINSKMRELRDTGYSPQWKLQRLAPTQLDKLADFTNTVESWNYVKNMASEMENILGYKLGNFTGTINDFINQYARDPRVASLQAEVQKAFQLYRKATTGAQASDKEIQTLRPLLPKLSDRPEIFFDKIEKTIAGTNRAKEAFLDTYAIGGYDVSEFQNEGQPTEQIVDGVKYILNKEDGLYYPE